jgi:hypothetical protein
MDGLIVWKCLIIFNFVFFLVWVLFYTYHLKFFFTDNDFVAPGETNRGISGAKNNGDSTFSVPGRSFVFLASIVFSMIIVIAVYLIMRYYDKNPRIKCKKGAKTMKECQLIT